MSASFFQLFPKPLLTQDQLKLLKYDNIPSGKYKTNFEINLPAKRFFTNEVEKYCYMWREGGQFSTKNYKKIKNNFMLIEFFYQLQLYLLLFQQHPLFYL